MTGLTITEKLYDATLNPTHAEAQLTLRVLTPAELDAAKAGQRRARRAWPRSPTTTRSRSARRSRVANLANATESIIGMIPH